MRGATGLSLSPFNHGERTPGQVPRRDAAWTLAPEAMELATAQAVPEAQLLLRHTAPVFRANDVAKGLGLDRVLEKRLGGMVKDAMHSAVNEAVFRQDLMGRLRSQQGLEPERRRAVFQRALMFWRTQDGGMARKQSQRMLCKAKKTEVPVSPAVESASAKLGIPEHKVPARGRADPVQQVMGDSKRALPPGAVRVHYSKTRGGYVRAEKLPDGSWKILGKVHDKDGGSAKKKDSHPELHPKDEHPSSPPPGKEPVHTRDGKPYRRHPNPPMTIGKAVVYSRRGTQGTASAEEKKNMEREELFKAIKNFQVPAADAPASDDVSKGESMEGMPSPGGAGGTMQKLDSSGHEKDPEQQLKPGKPEGHELGNGKGSGDGGGLGGATKDGGGMTKGVEPRADPRANFPVAMPTVRGAQWTQGPDARVAYSSVADEKIAKAMEDGTLSPEFGMPAHSPLYGLNKCGNCATGFSKALTVCPGCGTDRLAGTNVSGPRVQLAKSVTQRLTPPPPGDLHFED